MPQITHGLLIYKITIENSVDHTVGRWHVLVSLCSKKLPAPACIKVSLFELAIMNAIWIDQRGLMRVPFCHDFAKYCIDFAMMVVPTFVITTSDVFIVNI